MKLLAALLFLGIVALTAGKKVVYVHADNAEEQNARDILNILQRPSLPERYQPESYFDKIRGVHKSKLLSFSFKNCGNPATESIVIPKFELSPDPVHIPGQITLSFQMNITKPVMSPLEADVILKKKVLGFFVEIPCIDNIGSCNYQGICQLLDQIQCPESLVEQGLTCRCPLNPGSYSLPPTQVNLNLPVEIPSGDYMAQVTIKDQSQEIACYVVELSIA